MHILFAAVCSSGADDCTLNFATSLLNFLNSIEGTNQLSINFVTDINKALDLFARDKSYDRLILCNTRITASPEFLKAALASPYPFVSAIHPLTSMDWDAVSKKSSSSEDIAYRGLTYNVDLQTASKREGDYVMVSDLILGSAVLKREVVDTILHKYAKDVKGEPEHVFYTTRVVDGKTLTKDANFCRMWGKDIAADVANPVALSGPMAFCGSVGSRSVLR